jgi:hypothetical protein
MKMVKSIANKRGDWILGELENLNYDKREELISSENPEKYINDYMDSVEVELSKPLIQPLNLFGFEHEECVTEITTTKDLRSEGTRMGHCVGGYGNAIKEGRSRIFHIECDGIGSTFEVGFGTNMWPNFGMENFREVPQEWRDVLGTYSSDLRRLENMDKQVEKASFNSKQHYGRYPEKGNKTPTDTNKEIAKLLVEYINEHYLEDRIKELLWDRHQLETTLRKKVYEKKIELEKEKGTTKVHTRVYDSNNPHHIPANRYVDIDELPI